MSIGMHNGPVNHFSKRSRRAIVCSLLKDVSVVMACAILSAWTSGCAPIDAESGRGASREQKYHVVTVFYGTDRSVVATTPLGPSYGATLGNVQFGTCSISIPLDHRIGVVESPYFRYFESPERHIVVLSITPQSTQEFLKNVRTKIGNASKKSAFVFIHGYNVSFDDACRRTGQLAYDLKFPGAPLMWSWPSSGKTLDYMSDEAKIEWTIPNLRRFLEVLKESSDAETIHLIAHSMGSRAILRALEGVVASLHTDAKPWFNQLILTAPDIDAVTFRQLAAVLPKVSSRITLYASSDDEAMRASRRIHGNLPRAGEAGTYLLIVDGVDTVDASGIDTSFIRHSYFGDEASVISDLYDLLLTLKPPAERFYLREDKREGQAYWRFRR